MIRRLLRLALAAVVGYGFCWGDRAYGHAPLLLLALVAAVSWLAGAAHTALPLVLKLAQAERERDDACSLAVSLQEGATLEAVPQHVDRPCR